MGFITSILQFISKYHDFQIDVALLLEIFTVTYSGPRAVYHIPTIFILSLYFLTVYVSGFSDPYAIILLGNHRAKTRVVKKSLNPKWNQYFRL